MKILVLHDIRSALNVGAMFRTAEAIGISKIFLSGFTALPIDRFGRPNPKIEKSALGAETLVEWEYADNIFDLLGEFKEKGITVVSVEQGETAEDYKTYQPGKDTAVIMGNEVEGVSSEIQQASDVILEIPMYGEKESLNVATTCGIILYRLFDPLS